MIRPNQTTDIVAKCNGLNWKRKKNAKTWTNVTLATFTHPTYVLLRAFKNEMICNHFISRHNSFLYFGKKKKDFRLEKYFYLHTLNASYACTFYLKIEFGQFNNPLSERRPNKRKKTAQDKFHNFSAVSTLFFQCGFLSFWMH